MTRGEDDDFESWLLVDEMVGGWCVDDWYKAEEVI